MATENEKKMMSWFSKQMLKKITENRHRGEFTAMDMRFCIGRMRQEMDELLFSMWNHNHETNPKAKQKIAQNTINECADVANFAMSLAYNFIKQARGEK